MGWLANYRWIRSLEARQYPPEDTAKKMSSMKEIDAMRRIRRIPGVIDVYHAKRLTKAKTTMSRREIDLIVLKKDRIVLVEIKNYAGSVSMVDGVLHQNSTNRGWSFEILSDVRKRLIDSLRETGVLLGSGEVHMVLALLGSGSVDESVNTGNHLTQAGVSRSFGEIGEALNIPVSEEAEFSSEQLDAIRKFFQMCGTWDGLTTANTVDFEGDFTPNQDIKKWRERCESVSFQNTRGWLRTLFFGPDFQAELKSWDGEISFQTVEPSSSISLRLPGAKKRVITLRLDHLSSLTFGYEKLPEWERVTLMEKSGRIISENTNDPEARNEKKGGMQSEFRVGQTVKDATVAYHHDHGTFFQLTAKHKGMYFIKKMQPLEAQQREVVFRVGSNYDVRITKINHQGKIEIEPCE